MLLLTAGDRPASVYFRHGEVRIDVHDAWHRQIYKSFLARMIMTHPDKGKAQICNKVLTGAAFCALRRAFSRWLRDERAWYAAFKLTPPKVQRVNLPQTPSVKVVHTSKKGRMTDSVIPLYKTKAARSGG